MSIDRLIAALMRLSGMRVQLDYNSKARPLKPWELSYYREMAPDAKPVRLVSDDIEKLLMAAIVDVVMWGSE